MKILLVEDHRLVADAMQLMLRDLDTAMTVETCYSSHHALSTIDAGARFQLIVTDLFMPGIDGLGLLAGLRHRRVRTPVVVVSSADDDRYIRAAIEHGAAGFVRKTLPACEMLHAMRFVLKGGRYFPDRFVATQAAAVDGSASADTTVADGNREIRPGERQLEVLELMAAGHSNKQISHIVGISEATVKYHTSQLFRLLSVRNRTSCVREAHARGWLKTFQTAEA